MGDGVSVGVDGGLGDGRGGWGSRRGLGGSHWVDTYGQGEESEAEQHSRITDQREDPHILMGDVSMRSRSKLGSAERGQLAPLRWRSAKGKKEFKSPAPPSFLPRPPLRSTLPVRFA